MTTTTNPYCRLCTLKTENFIDVFHNDSNALQLVPKIKQCLQIFLTPDDVLPKIVCVNCCEKVLEYSDFFSMCSKSQLCLIEIFGKESNDSQKDLNTIDFNINTLSTNETMNDKVHEQLTFSAELAQKLQECGVIQNQPPDNRLILNNEVSKTAVASDSSSLLHNILDDQSEEGEQSEEGDDSQLGLDSMNKCVWKCATCDQDLQSLAALRSHHLNVHQQPPVYKCYMCYKIYGLYRSYARHIKTHMNPHKFSCTICSKSFSQKTILQSHMAVHSEIRPHVCVYCGKSFKQFSSLYLHSKCHLPEKAKTKFQCNQCEKSFTTKPSLEAHIKVHKGERNFICDICGKRFFAKNSLDYHISTHNDEKPHNCPTCGKCFKTTRLLSKHITVHTGVKPHQCDVCGKQFRERGALKEHSRIHTGVMPYSCEFCGKLFRFKGILTVHRRLHTGERPYSCQICHREFTNWANYNKHMKRRHSMANNTKRTEEQPPPENVAPIEPSSSFDQDLAVLVAGQQYLQTPDSHSLFRVGQFPTNSLQLGSYYLPPHTTLSSNQ